MSIVDKHLNGCDQIRKARQELQDLAWNLKSVGMSELASKIGFIEIELGEGLVEVIGAFSSSISTKPKQAQ